MLTDLFIREQIIWHGYLVFGFEIPSSTQQMCVFSSPMSTTQALLKPAPNVAQTDSYSKITLYNFDCSIKEYL